MECRGHAVAHSDLECRTVHIDLIQVRRGDIHLTQSAADIGEQAMGQILRFKVGKIHIAGGAPNGNAAAVSPSTNGRGRITSIARYGSPWYSFFARYRSVKDTGSRRNRAHGGLYHWRPMEFRGRVRKRP